MDLFSSRRGYEAESGRRVGTAKRLARVTWTKPVLSMSRRNGPSGFRSRSHSSYESRPFALISHASGVETRHRRITLRTTSHRVRKRRAVSAAFSSRVGSQNHQMPNNPPLQLTPQHKTLSTPWPHSPSSSSPQVSSLPPSSSSTTSSASPLPHLV